MTILQRILSIGALLLLAACGGGGGDAGTPAFGGGGGSGGSTGGGTGGGTATPTAADLVLVLSSPTINTSGTATVTATVTALDANRNTLASVPVALSVNSGAVVTPSATVTGENGSLTGTIGIGSDTAPRVITVTATSGSLSRTASLQAVTGAPVVPTAADLTLVLSSPSIANTGTATITATVTAVDSNRNAIAGIPVTLRVNNDATVVVSGGATSELGVVTGTVGIGSNRADRPILVTAISGALTREAVLQVRGTQIADTALPTVIEPNRSGRIQYRVSDAANSPLGNFPIIIVSPQGTSTQATTDLNGFYEYTYTAPTTGSEFEIRAAAGGVEKVSRVVLQSGAGAILPADLLVRSASVRANPSVVAVNPPGSTDSRAEIRALFVGDGNLPIPRVRVRFDLNGDANGIGGSLSTGSELVYSDVNGVAASAYIPAARSSPTDGVTVRACWDYADFPVGTCPNAGVLTSLTVISEPLSVSVGTDNLVIVGQDLVYSQRFVVQVNDSSGLAKSDVQISPLLDLTSYDQGRYNRVGDEWEKQTSATNCGNEDVNRNGVLEIYSNGGVEDANGNRQLDPRKADVVVSFEGSNRTDATGRVTLRITYPRNVGSWVKYLLTVAATGISGTEGRASFSGSLIVPSSDIRAEAEPPFRFSPYGETDGGNRRIVRTPDGRSSETLCTR